ncbi:uncharacterized protein I303_108396 [Kwoniella dejecticola CBS 10117]|uniref:Uncharacterized protein n=1 Tax=Kwoniella dejecticola CBS 10117 TaxID=1296121 RepID=A0A1A5ZXI2_9TREE|nr:uncharacterized protein I303_07277 [Kwoniella dejecticola CBS 10117]OBR82517.1 hypothetical protein I303_07277 [Kwoniella dejecticola CBS 10117]
MLPSNVNAESQILPSTSVTNPSDKGLISMSHNSGDSELSSLLPIRDMAVQQSTPVAIKYEHQGTVDTGFTSQLPTPSLTSNSTMSNASDMQAIPLSSSASALPSTSTSTLRGGGASPTTASTSSIPAESDLSRASPSTHLANGTTNTPRPLSSLDRLRQFKAEVEASRNNAHTKTASPGRGTGTSTATGISNTNAGGVELDPGKLAKMAESFILQQQQGQQVKKEPSRSPTASSSTIAENGAVPSDRERALKEQLKSRTAQGNSRSPTAAAKKSPPADIGYTAPTQRGEGQEALHGQRQEQDERRNSTAPANPPWKDRDQDRSQQRLPVSQANDNRSLSTSASASGSASTTSAGKFQPPHPDDARFSRRDVPAAAAGADHKPSATNFVTPKFQRPANSSNKADRYSRTPPPRSSHQPTAQAREQYDRPRAHDGQRLADRITGTPPGSGPGSMARSRERSRSPRPAQREYRRGRSPPPLMRDHGRQPSPPRHYPDPRTPVLPDYTAREDRPGPYDAYSAQRLPHAGGRGGPEQSYGRIPSPPYGKTHAYRPADPPTREYGRDRYHGYGEDAYARHPHSHPHPHSPPPPPAGYHRKQYPDDPRYHGPPYPPGSMLPAGVDTNNVVETLEALKAQISKLEKLVPTAATIPYHAPPPPPPPPLPQQAMHRGYEYDPYAEYARQYGADRPREPHPREREYDPRPVGRPGSPYPPPHGRDSAYEEDRNPQGLRGPGPPSPRGAHAGHAPPPPKTWSSLAAQRHYHIHSHGQEEYNEHSGGRGGRGGRGGGRGGRGKRRGRGLGRGR